MKGYAQSSGYADQALNAIKVVQTYGNEELEDKNFQKYLAGTRKIQSGIAVKKACTSGFLFFIFMVFYAYCFYFGGLLIWTAYEDAILQDDFFINPSNPDYSGGSIIAIMFMIIIGAISAGGAGEHYSSIAQAKIGGRLAYETINHMPKIHPSEPGSKMVAAE